MTEKVFESLNENILVKVTGGLNSEEIKGILKIGYYYKSIHVDAYDLIKSVDVDPNNGRVTVEYSRFTSNSVYGDWGYSETEYHPFDDANIFISIHELTSIGSIDVHEIF